MRPTEAATEKAVRLEITARFFGVYRELAGASERSITLPPDGTVSDLVAALRDSAGLDFLPERPLVAVNRAYAAPDLRLVAGDEIALIPPVAGG